MTYLKQSFFNRNRQTQHNWSWEFVGPSTFGALSEIQKKGADLLNKLRLYMEKVGEIKDNLKTEHYCNWKLQNILVSIFLFFLSQVEIIRE